MWKRFIAFIFLLGFYFSVSSPLYAEYDTETIYAKTEKSVYQVRVLNKKTGKKSSIGSGFLVNYQNIMVTNYHVVSSFLNNPEDYRLEYLSIDGRKGSLEFLDLDVVHDLAVLRADKALGSVLEIVPVPEKGALIYSMGNPMDLGLSIIKGTNNGLMPHSEDSRILFSGSLNPGMSGGPALNTNKQVIGVNVATAGNDISFLVPAARYLSEVLSRLKARSYAPIPLDQVYDVITQQVLTYQKQYLNRMMTQKWSSTVTGQFSTPAEIARSIRCWDSSPQLSKDALYSSIFTRCSNEYDIYLSSNLEVGNVFYEYYWLKSEALGSKRFYRLYEERFNSEIGSNANDEDVTNFVCHMDFVEVAKQSFKMNVCRRDYIRYKGLSDVMVVSALTGNKDKGFFFNMDFHGTDFDSTMQLVRKMLGAFQWQN